jgi:hypothetical protein
VLVYRLVGKRHVDPTIRAAVAAAVGEEQQ